QRLAWFGAGLGVALGPMGYLALRDFDVFWFNNLGFHKVNTEWRTITGYATAMEWPGKLKYGAESVMEAWLLVGLLGVLFVNTTIHSGLRRAYLRSDGPWMVFFFALSLLGA